MDVFLATHGRPDLLEQTLKSILAARSQGSIQQIVVVENGGDFGAERIINQLNHRRLITLKRVKEANKSRAINTSLCSCNEGLSS